MNLGHLVVDTPIGHVKREQKGQDRAKRKGLSMDVTGMTKGRQGGNRLYAGSFGIKSGKSPNFGGIKAKILEPANR